MVSSGNMSTLSLIPEEKRKFLPNPSKSTESLYSSSSSKYSTSVLLKRKAAGSRPPGFIPATNQVRQRVLSARRLRMKTLQNQLSDAQQHISELANENRILRTLHKRQDSALSKYENTNAELPQLLHSHAEEIRIWQAKYRNLHIQNKELASKLKQKESMLLSLGDQNKHLIQLSRDKNLEERERLTERVRFLENRLIEKDSDMKLLSRRIQLEAKNFKTQLHNEHQKYKELLAKLERSRIELGKISQTQFDIKERNQKGMMPRSLSGSKLPKHVRDFGLLNPDRTDETKCSLSTPSLFEDIRPIQDLKTCKSAESSSGDSPKPVKSSQCKGRMSRRSSAARRENAEFDSLGLANAIERGMSKLLTVGGAENQDNSSDEREFATTNAKSKFDDQPNPSENDEVDDQENNDDNEDYDDPDYDENDDSADVIVGNKIIAETYQKDEIEYKSRQDLMNIRQQMSEDYRQRETFLDTFCRQSSNVEKNSEKELSGRRPSNIDPKKKNQLLAALKAIETDEDLQEP